MKYEFSITPTHYRITEHRPDEKIVVCSTNRTAGNDLSDICDLARLASNNKLVLSREDVQTDDESTEVFDTFYKQYIFETS